MTEGRKGSAGDGRGRILPDGAGRQGVADKADAAAGRGGRKAWGGTYIRQIPGSAPEGMPEHANPGIQPDGLAPGRGGRRKGDYLTEGMARLPATMSEGTESART